MYPRLFFLVLSGAVASDTTSNWHVVLKVFENCGNRNDSLTCLRQKALNLVDRASELQSIELLRGIKFVKDEHTRRMVDESSSDVSSIESKDEIWNRVNNFFTTHSVEMNIPKFLDTVNLLEEARGKKKGYGGILLIAAAAKGVMLYFGMQAVAAIAGKALLVAKVALTIASVIALKKLLGGGGEKTAYEIVKHPQHSYVQTHSSSHEFGNGHGGGWERHNLKRSIDTDHDRYHLQSWPVFLSDHP